MNSDLHTFALIYLIVVLAIPPVVYWVTKPKNKS